MSESWFDDLAVVPRSAVVLLLTACSSPPPKTPVPPTTTETSPLVRTWLVADHVLVKGASISAADAAGFHGRTLDITAEGFMSPWQGTCERASRTEHPRTVAEVISELGVIAADRAKVAAFGLADPATEYRIECEGSARPIPLMILVGGERAMTCYGGACYLMNRF